MAENLEHMPSCFGHLDTVFPKGNDELRHTPGACLSCSHKTECLRSAMNTNDGLNAREEVVDRAYASGMMGFFERWSKKKSLRRRMKNR